MPSYLPCSKLHQFAKWWCFLLSLEFSSRTSLFFPFLTSNLNLCTIIFHFLIAPTKCPLSLLPCCCLCTLCNCGEGSHTLSAVSCRTQRAKLLQSRPMRENLCSSHHQNILLMHLLPAEWTFPEQMTRAVHIIPDELSHCLYISQYGIKAFYLFWRPPDASSDLCFIHGNITTTAPR